MNLSLPEKQLIYILTFKKRIKDPTNKETLKNVGKRFFDEDLADWIDAYENLTEKGIIQQEDGIYSLTEAGQEAATEVQKFYTIERYNQGYIAYEKSRAYGLYCQKVNGMDFRQVNLIDMEGLEKLIKVANLDSTKTALDLGCGVGRLTEYISDKTGAKITGIDIADKAMELANQRTQNKRDRLQFLAQDIENLDFPPDNFDTILCVDSLYHMGGNLEPIIKKLVEITKPGGQWSITFGNNGRDGRLFSPDETKFGVLLQKLNLDYDAYDFTKNLHEFWHNCKQAATDLQPEFEAEDNVEFGQGLIAHAQHNLKFIEHASYYVYHVKL